MSTPLNPLALHSHSVPLVATQSVSILFFCVNSLSDKQEDLPSAHSMRHFSNDWSTKRGNRRSTGENSLYFSYWLLQRIPQHLDSKSERSSTCWQLCKTRVLPCGVMKSMEREYKQDRRAGQMKVWPQKMLEPPRKVVRRKGVQCSREIHINYCVKWKRNSSKKVNFLHIRP